MGLTHRHTKQCAKEKAKMGESHKIESQNVMKKDANTQNTSREKILQVAKKRKIRKSVFIMEVL